MKDGDKILVLRVAASFQRLADQAPGQRAKDKKLVNPINPPKGIDKAIAKNNGLPMEPGHDDTVDPNKRDIRPQDVFTPTPNQINVLNFAQTGKDQSGKVEKQIKKDKGYDAVRNLSQYLIETQGGGGAKPHGG